MPENYIQPVTDRQKCYTCHKTVTGKRKLSKCSKCHAITYCGKECQVADFARHKWNCIPVMVTEYEGRGRGVIAARDIKMGEVIFLDKPVLKVPKNPESFDRAVIESIEKQINNMPSEAKLQYNKLVRPNLKIYQAVIESMEKQINNMPSEAKLQYNKLVRPNLMKEEDEEFIKAAGVIADHSMRIGDWCFLYLNVALINHSCAPNAFSESIEKEGDTWHEVRAIKNISKGEEVTQFLNINGSKEMDERFTIIAFGSSQDKRAVLKKHFRFGCQKPCVCSGIVPDQEDIVTELLDLHRRRRFDLSQLGKREEASFWTEHVKIVDKIADLTLELDIGCVMDKIESMKLLTATAAEAQDEILLKKALNGLRNIAEDTGIRSVVKFCEEFISSDEFGNINFNFSKIHL